MIRGFNHYDNRITQFFSSAFRSSLSTGGTSSKGYASTLSGFVASVYAILEKNKKHRINF